METAKYVARFTNNDLILTEEEIGVDEKLVEVVGDAIIRREGIFTYKRITPTSVAVLMPNPLDYQRRESFFVATDLQVDEIAVAPASLVETLMKKYFKEDTSAPVVEEGDMSELVDVLGAEYDTGGEVGGISAEDADDEESAPIIQMANRIVEDAYICGASDIHIEPQENDLLIRYRVDGICAEKLRLPKQVGGGLVARLKIMADLDIAEKRLPQDGRIVFKKFTKKNMNIDLRVATPSCGHRPDEFRGKGSHAYS